MLLSALTYPSHKHPHQTHHILQVDTVKFPDFEGMVGWIHDQGIHVILWVTSFVNEENPEYQMAVDNKYLVRNEWGKVRPIEWWHGKGGLLDYSNPEATEWWHGLMDKVRE